VSLLLDAHVLLWLLAGERDRFGRRTLAALRDRPSLVSAASIWEIAIKRSLGKLKAPPDVVATVASRGLRLLSITALHAAHVAELPDLHRDPFDRLLVAQAHLESLTIVTADRAFARYRVAVLDAAS
jgi:PIN domain nuclease of toxin-antitoxin system